MTIEPTAAHTVYRLAVMPPKPAPRVLAPALSMADDAKLIRKRATKAWGFTTAADTAAHANAARVAQARARRDDMAARVLAALATGPMSTGELEASLGASHNLMRSVLTQLRADGRIACPKAGLGISAWTIRNAEGTE